MTRTLRQQATYLWSIPFAAAPFAAGLAYAVGHKYDFHYVWMALRRLAARPLSWLQGGRGNVNPRAS